jgi:hypothetical protein
MHSSLHVYWTTAVQSYLCVGGCRQRGCSGTQGTREWCTQDCGEGVSGEASDLSAWAGAVRPASLFYYLVYQVMSFGFRNGGCGVC